MLTMNQPALLCGKRQRQGQLKRAESPSPGIWVKIYHDDNDHGADDNDEDDDDDLITESLRWFADIVLCATVALGDNHYHSNHYDAFDAYNDYDDFDDSHDHLYGYYDNGETDGNDKNDEPRLPAGS